MGVITSRQDVRDTFESNWVNYVTAILEYAANTPKKNVNNILQSLKKQGTISKCITV